MKLWMLGSLLFLSIAGHVQASDEDKVRQAALDYIESQHQPNEARMDRALHSQLAKRTYWLDAEGNDTILETDKQVMLNVAKTYNIAGDKFPKVPKKDIQILDITNRVASVKLTADDWIDYMHLVKNEQGNWQIINVLWQYHDMTKHQSK